MQNKGPDDRSVLSVNGRVGLSRRRYASRGQGGESIVPADRLLDEAEATVSVGVRQLCCREGTNARSFARGRENLKKLAQIEMGKEPFRQVVVGEGKKALAAARKELSPGWSAKDCVAPAPPGQAPAPQEQPTKAPGQPTTPQEQPTKPPGQAAPPEGQEPITRMYVGGDGVLVPTITQAEKDKRRAAVQAKRSKLGRKRRRRLAAVKKGSDQRYKQIYVTAFYDQEQKHRLVGVTRQGTMGLRRLLRRDAARVCLRAAVERVGLVDGAVCLRRNLECLPLQEILLDFFHLGEHVGEAGVKTQKEAGDLTPRQKQWVEEVLHTVRHEGYAPFFQELLDWRGGLRGHKRKAADALIKYVTAREEMIRYEECDRHGWDVGSGPIESMCGVTTDRIKGRGRRWDLDNAEAMMQLEAMYQSTDMWDQYWSNVLCNHG